MSLLGNKNITAIYKAFWYSMSGLKFLLKERAFKQEIILSLVTIFLIFIFDITAIIRLYVISSLFLVLILEAVNTAIETTINRIGLEFHEISKVAKDVGSAFVFLSLMHLVIVLVFAFLC